MKPPDGMTADRTDAVGDSLMIEHRQRRSRARSRSEHAGSYLPGEHPERD